ncbi:unnamed protein product [Adineta ricciae]|uniref:PKD/REJ-like domain-containing protein n=1 Tax=Adineta ricciae TaxID=249248 RepID=A0A815RCS4_ADIRI|nr:unnamed protein product [Adineta ricciae]
MPSSVFITKNNTIYVTNYQYGKVIVWIAGNSTPSNTISGNLNEPLSLFITDEGDILVDAGNPNGLVARFMPNGTKTAPAMYTSSYCSGLFVDINNTLYCAMDVLHQIVKCSLSSSSNATIAVAGKFNESGSMPDELNYPNGIFVDINFDVYVADSANSRIQIFQAGKLNATTAAGTGLNGSVTLTYPTSVALDADNNLYIVDFDDNRVIVSGPNGFRCIAACSGKAGSGPTKLNAPSFMAFDTYGNMFVVDGNNSRIQKFSLISNSCDLTTSDPTTTQYQTKYRTSIDSTINKITQITSNKQTTASTITSTVTTNITTKIATTIASTTTTAAAAAAATAVTATTPAAIPTTTIATTTTAAAAATTVTATIPAAAGTATTTPAATAVTATTPAAIPTTTIATTTTIPAAAGTTTTTAAATAVTATTPAAIPTTTIAATTRTTTTAATTAVTAIPTTTIAAATTTTTASQILFANQSCFSPNVMISPPAPSLNSPLEIQRSQDIYFISLIDLNCNQSFSVSTKWTVTGCTSICSSQIELDEQIITTYSELYIPLGTLQYGIYKFDLTVTMIDIPWLQTTTPVYVRIIPSLIKVNLVQYGTSMITYGYNENLLLDPGSFSIDLDEPYFNAANWVYKYYCRIYGQYNFPNFQGSLITIDNPMINSLNSSCLSNQTGWKFVNSINSSITILSHSLQPNQTYQFMVYMENRENSSLQGTGYLLVDIEDNPRQTIGIGCVIQTMCAPNMEFQAVNPSTQVALFSTCLNNCSTIENITWNIYTGSINSSSNVTRWTLFNQINLYENIWFFGRNTSNFTSTNQLFIVNSQINLWRFEVLYQFPSESSRSALNFIINQPPTNGSCSIFPFNGTTNTLFTISCPNWFDENGIKDYSLYYWTNGYVKRSIIAFSLISTFEVRLPADDLNTSVIHLTVFIRDQFDCIQEVNITSVTIIQDLLEINNLLNNIKTNSTLRLISSTNQNVVGQVIYSFSQQLNQLDGQNIDKALSNNISLTSVSISQLGEQRIQQMSVFGNTSALNDFNQKLNSQANVREYLMNFTDNLPILTLNSILFQSIILSELTKSTNQLTRLSSIIASNKCYQLAKSLNTISTKIAFEHVQIGVDRITQCITNVLTAINGPLQERTTLLDLDYFRANDFPVDYDTDLESPWSNPNLFANGNDFSWNTMEKNRDLYYQKRAQTQISEQSKQTIAFLTSALNNHLNIGQNFTINSSSVFMSLQTTTFQSVSNGIIKSIGNAQVQLPSNMNSNDNYLISFRSIVQPLASADQSPSNSYTNLSTTISFSILDRNGNELSFPTLSNNPYRLIIPRDVNLILPSMTLQNATSMNGTPHHLLFNLHYVDLSQLNGISVSIHMEMKPLNLSLGYLLVYKFDSSPVLNSSMSEIDHWSLFCPSNLTINNMYTYFINNQLTNNHKSLIFGLRELNSTEISQYCTTPPVNPPITDAPFDFTSDYELRLYTSGCYYLDSNNQWQSDGLIVGSLTNTNETECFSTHLTTFAGGFLVLPSPINWNYVFLHANFNRNKTIYITMISVSILYLLIMIYARFKNKNLIEKFGVIALEDNRQEDQYCYQIIVFIDHRKDAETKSQVRTFNYSKQNISQHGDIDSSVITVPKSLGKLNSICIWHNNKDNLLEYWKYLIICNLQILEKSDFICQRWFAIDKHDERVEHLLPVSNELPKHEFLCISSKEVYWNISEDHLCLTISFHSPSNNFSRVQRCTYYCILTFTLMLLDILYYNQMNETNGKTSLLFDPLYTTYEQIEIVIIVELLIFCSSLYFVQFFRHIQLLLTNSSDKSKTKKRFQFPWWRFISAYRLLFIIGFISMSFIVVHIIEFGNLKTQKWIISLIHLVEPIKIFALTTFFVCFIRESAKEKQANEYFVNFLICSNQRFHQFKQVDGSRNDFVHLRDNEKISTIHNYWNLFGKFVFNHGTMVIHTEIFQLTLMTKQINRSNGLK